MARVYRALDRETKSVVALKKVATSGVKANEAAIRREIDIYMRIQQLSCKHLLTVIDIFREEDTYALVTEFADGGTLWSLVVEEGGIENARPLGAGTVRDIALQISDGLSVLHENNIIHRDIKPQNILRCDDTWKIADFGISKFTSKPVTGYTFQGAHTQPWAPPEQIQGAQAHPSADIYALGKVLLFLLTGKSGVSQDNEIPVHWIEIIAPCIEIDPVKRPVIATVQGQLAGMTL
jgi:serine/threonine-protein kinase